MTDRRRLYEDCRPLYVVPKGSAPAPPPRALYERQLPPIKPRRSAAAVRKSLRVALSAASELADTVTEADARAPSKARKAVQRLEGHAKRVSRLVDELHHAVECEARYHLWLRGRSYVE